MNKVNKETNRQIVFSEKTDDAINGYALAITFVLISIFVFVKNDYFYFPIIANIVGVFLGIIGIVGCGIEISKSVSIKGIGNICLGILCLLLWYAIYICINNIILNILVFSLLMLGCYGIALGILQFFYSVGTLISSVIKENDKMNALKDVFLLLTQLLGVVLTLLNILKLVGIII